MSVLTLEGIVENGQIRLPTGMHLPEKTKVYVVVPEIPLKKTARIYSPKLANPKQADDFKMEMFEEPSNAHL
jgi:hypothetical protein